MTLLTICSLALISSNALSDPQKITSETNAHVRLMKNSDGSTTEFKRDINNTTLEKNTYREDARGEKVIISKTVYERDKQGRLRNGFIEDGQRVKLYTLRYGYDPETGRLIAENMFDARTIRRNDPKDPKKETPVRALRYSYDAQGIRSAPSVYSGLSGRSAEELQDWLKKNKFEKGTIPDVDPFSPTTINPNARRLSN
jgi:hypothetical protein